MKKTLTGEIPLMSRDTEMDWILARLKRPEPVAFVLAGAAGVGKTRLASEAARSAAGLGFTTAQAVASRAASAIPFGPFAPFLPEAGYSPGDLLGGRHPPRADVLVPRDCPRGCIWPGSTTSAEDRERFFGQSDTGRIHVIEAGWLDRVLACRLYAYRLPTGPFRPHEVGGYWVTDQPVEAIERVGVDDVLGRHARARIELRITPSIWPFWRRVAGSTVKFSGSRLGNAAPHPERPG